MLMLAMMVPPTVVHVQGGFAGLDGQGNLVLNAGPGHNVSLLGDAMLVNGRDLGAFVAAAVQLQLAPLQVIIESHASCGWLRWHVAVTCAALVPAYGLLHCLVVECRRSRVADMMIASLS